MEVMDVELCSNKPQSCCRNWCIVLCIGGMDYQSKAYNVTVEAEETSAVVSIAIFDDSIVSASSVDSVTESILDDDHVLPVTLLEQSTTRAPCWCTSAM